MDHKLASSSPSSSSSSSAMGGNRGGHRGGHDHRSVMTLAIHLRAKRLLNTSYAQALAQDWWRGDFNGSPFTIPPDTQWWVVLQRILIPPLVWIEEGEATSRVSRSQ